jgi:hypothetical protein
VNIDLVPALALVLQGGFALSAGAYALLPEFKFCSRPYSPATAPESQPLDQLWASFVWFKDEYMTPSDASRLPKSVT